MQKSLNTRFRILGSKSQTPGGIASLYAGSGTCQTTLAADHLLPPFDSLSHLFSKSKFELDLASPPLQVHELALAFHAPVNPWFAQPPIYLLRPVAKIQIISELILAGSHH